MAREAECWAFKLSYCSLNKNLRVTLQYHATVQLFLIIIIIDKATILQLKKSFYDQTNIWEDRSHESTTETTTKSQQWLNSEKQSEKCQ